MGKTHYSAEGPWIVWNNFGEEGWRPESFQTWEDAVAFMEGGGHHQPMVITLRFRPILRPLHEEIEE